MTPNFADSQGNVYPDAASSPDYPSLTALINLNGGLLPHIVINLDPGHWAFDNFHLYHPS